MRHAIILTLLFVTNICYSQIPVTVTSDIPSIINQIETMAKWKQQFDQMKSQIDQMKQQYEAITGSRGMGTILNNPQLRDYLQDDWKNVYDQVKNGGYSGLTGTAKDIYDANKVFDACSRITVADQRQACEASAVKSSQDKGFALDAYDVAKSRINQIESLMSSINGTSDAKAIAELQGRIAAEQAMIQNEQTKLQLYKMVSEAEEKIQQQRIREMNARTWSARDGIQVQPLTFN